MTAIPPPFRPKRRAIEITVAVIALGLVAKFARCVKEGQPPSDPNALDEGAWGEAEKAARAMRARLNSIRREDLAAEAHDLDLALREQNCDGARSSETKIVASLGQLRPEDATDVRAMIDTLDQNLSAVCVTH